MRLKAPASFSGLSTIAWPPNDPGSLDAGRAGERDPLAYTEVVLREVVGQQPAVGHEVARDDAVLLRRAVEPVEDAAERPADQALVLSGLAGLDQLAALVEVVAHGEREVLLALGHRDVRERSEQERVGEQVLGLLGQAVVAALPHDGVEVAEHAERVGNALGVDVPGGVRDAVGRERGGVVVGVLGRGRTRAGRSG